jgi:methylated-DNA-[protein]-cysteine S-methyltransferase
MTVDMSVTKRFLERAEAKGLVDVAVTTMDSPVGTLLLMATPKGLVRIAFETENRDEVLGEVAMRISPRILEAPRRLDPVRRELDRYFAGRLQDFDVPLDWSLVGDFARRVLRRTARIPYGSVASYGNVALEIGTPRAARAVGNALGSNPIPVVVPCHRVVRSGGTIGGYGGGLQRKRWLLALEAGAPATSREAAPTG